MTASHELLRAAAKKLNSKHIETEAYALRGVPKQVLLEKIQMLQPDIVIMGKRGHGVISRLLMGSIALHTMQSLPIPVILVPDRNE